ADWSGLHGAWNGRYTAHANKEWAAAQQNMPEEWNIRTPSKFGNFAKIFDLPILIYDIVRSRGLLQFSGARVMSNEPFWIEVIVYLDLEVLDYIV
ncbi:19_t:CDS:2, partial [Cetraspora pellucida]